MRIRNTSYRLYHDQLQARVGETRMAAIVTWPTLHLVHKCAIALDTSIFLDISVPFTFVFFDLFDVGQRNALSRSPDSLLFSLTDFDLDFDH